MKCTKIRILAIDDEACLRKVVHLMVVGMGYDCVCVKSCQEALDAITISVHSGDPLSVGIVDLTIQGESGGLNAARRIRDAAPDLPLIVTSGYTEHEVMLAPERYGFAAALPKPFLKGELNAALSAVLETRSNGVRKYD